MKIELNNLPVTIETINVDGRKLTKQFLQQIPIEIPLFEKNGSNELFKTSKIISLNSDELKDYIFREKIIGWVNLQIEKTSEIKMKLDIISQRWHMYEFLIVLFVDSKDGKLKRTFMETNFYQSLFQDKYPQLYI